MDKYLVVGRGLVGSIFQDLPEFDVVSHKEWYFKAHKHPYEGIVCAAAMSTEAQCVEATMAEVVEANVNLPLRILRHAKSRYIPCVVYSTAGVYRKVGVNTEMDDVHPHNRYTASKIFMEARLSAEVYPQLYIFRIPFVVLFNNHLTDLSARVQNWTQVEDVTASVVYRAVLAGSVEAAMRGETRGGIFNVSSGDVHFPSFLEDRFGWRGEVVPAHSMGRTPNSQLDTRKAKEQGLITTC